MRKALLTLSILFFQTLSLIVFASTTQAANTIIARPPCEKVGQCIENKTCKLTDPVIINGNQVQYIILGTETNCGSSKIGSVTPPGPINRFNQVAGLGNQQGNLDGIGIVLFISNLLKVFAIVTGIWAMFNFAMAGYTLISGPGEAGALEKIKEQTTMSMIGLALIAGAYIIAGLIGLFMFGDAGFILNPKLEGAV